MTASPALRPTADVASFVNNYCNAWSGTDEDLILSYYADDVVLQIPGLLMEGKEALRDQFVRPFITAFPGNRHLVKSMTFGPGVVVVEFSFEAQHTGPFAGHVASGAQVSLPGCGVYQYDLVKRQVTAGRIYFDVGTLLETITNALPDDHMKRDNAQSNEHNLSLITNAIPTLIHVLRDDGSVLYVNQAVLSYTGHTLDDARKEGYLARCFHPEDLEKLRNELQLARIRPAPFENEARVLGKDGRYRWFLIGYNPLLDQQGRVDRWYAAAFDIEDRRRAETERKQAKHDLECAFEEIRILKDQLQQENIALREEVDKVSMFDELVGTSPALHRVLRNIAQVAPSDCTVLITGETGTGKELVARAIHKHSARASRPFVSVNCAGIPPSLIASELFGHEKGAFTGAVVRREGRFELAAGGTLFLDEVGDLPAETQVALLRVLQEREFERVGGDRPIRADVRVIAATNRSLEIAIAEKTFRADLFYRLNVFPIEVPALKERREDIPLLVEYFTHRYGTRTGKRISRIPKATLEALRAYDWPGNIRELQNVVERAVIISDQAALTVDLRWLPGACRSPGSLSPSSPDGATLLDSSPPGATDLAGRRDADHERPVIEAALEQAKGRVAGPFGAAEKLGMPPSTLESKIKALQIDKNRFKPVPPTRNSREVSAKPS
jgi:steroid delta-isomerase-like uncharacterized protein